MLFLHYICDPSCPGFGHITACVTMSLGESLLGADAGYQQMGGPQAAPRLPRRASMGVATAGEVIAAVEADEGQCPQSMLQTDPHHGLSHGEAAKRLRDYGPNALPEEKVNPCLVFLGHFWGPMPIMIWVAIAVEFALATINNEPVGYLDAGILLVLQLLNGLVGWHEGQKAGDAIAAQFGIFCSDHLEQAFRIRIRILD